MTVFYPPELPQFVTSDRFQKGAGDGRLRTRMGSGQSKVRRLTGMPVKPLSAQAHYSRGELGRFWTWWEDDLRGGSLPFFMRNQIIDGRALLDDDFEEVTDEDDNPILITAWWLCLFGEGQPTETALGAELYRVAFELEILP